VDRAGYRRREHPLLLEARAGADLPPVDPGELPWLASPSATSAGPPTSSAGCAPPICTSAFPRWTISSPWSPKTVARRSCTTTPNLEHLALNTDLAATVEALAPLGSLP